MPQHLVKRPSGRRAALAVVALVTSGALAISGCESAVNSAEQPSGSKKGGTLTIVQSADIDPATFLAQNNPNFSIIRTVFNTLTTYDHDTLQPQPELATSWQQSADGKSITLQLRHDVTFHSGRPFTAADVIFTIKAMQREDVISQQKAVALAADTVGVIQVVDQLSLASATRVIPAPAKPRR